MINVSRTFLPPMEEYFELLKEIWDSNWVTNNGPMLKKFSADLRDYLGCPYTEVVGNGTIAIQIAIKALGLTNGDIITTPFSYVATTSSILWENCRPVFVDINDSLCIDPNLIEAAITPKTKAILATHVYGLPCDVIRIEEIAIKYGLYVIYDGAHALGCSYLGKSLLSYGDISTLSLHATKLVHSIEGGAIVTSSKDLFGTISLMGKFGHRGEDEYVLAGINAKNSELHAAMGILTLKRIQSLIAERKNITESYESRLTGVSLKRPKIPEGLTYNYSYYPVIFSSHDDMIRVRQALAGVGVNCRRYFYPSLNCLPYLESTEECPNSELITERVLCLPMFNGLREEDVSKIASVILKNL